MNCTFDDKSKFQCRQKKINTQKCLSEQLQIPVVTTNPNKTIQSSSSNEVGINVSENNSLTCVKCSKSFASNKILKNHIRRVHVSSMIVCPKCSQNFKRVDNFRKHEKKYHPADARAKSMVIST